MQVPVHLNAFRIHVVLNVHNVFATQIRAFVEYIVLVRLWRLWGKLQTLFGEITETCVLQHIVAFEQHLQVLHLYLILI